LIVKINFYHHTERLLIVGRNDFCFNGYDGIREVFEIAEDEQLIGCELYLIFIFGSVV
jgi:hypothetical protein